MSEIVNQRKLPNDSKRIRSAIDQGRSLAVTRNLVSVGDLRTLRRQRLVDARLVTELFRGAPSVDPEQFRRELDAGVDQTVDPRA